MKGLIIFLTFCVSAVWLGPAGPLAEPVAMNDFDVRIISGANASPGQFPWQAAVLYLKGGVTYFCGGTLIGTQWVLTAAQCVANATLFQVQLGSNTLQDIDANRVTVITNLGYPHPNYSASTLNNDIGLIKIPAVTLSTYIQTLTIWSTVLGSGVNITVSGFGRTSDSSASLSNQLKYVIMTTITNAVCTSTFGSIIQSTMFCATGTGTKNFCGGDGGGPATVTVSGTTRHVGIPSFVSSLGCESGNPSGFTRSRDYKAWITSVTGLIV